jgi:hypothetical protein
MNHRLPRSSAARSAAGLVLALMIAAASAQNAPTASATPAPDAKAAPQPPSAGVPMQDGAEQVVTDEEVEFTDMPPLQVGDAASNLLAWQREGDIASSTPRPIAGDVARRSYERYLKSFEYPIPERLGSTVKTGSNASGGK